MKKDDNFFMNEALELAKKSYEIGEVPVGAVVVSPYGEIWGRGMNKIESINCQCAHAEIFALEDATEKTSNWRLEGCTLYVTLEPCVMCLGCMVLSRIERLVYAADSPEFGYRGVGISQDYENKIKNITRGIMREESEKLLKEFFEIQRRKK